jgi:hypothetical protein
MLNEMWILVKYLDSTMSTWFTTTDDLKGYNYILTTNEAVFPYASSSYTKFLFFRELNSSAGHKWFISPKLSVIPATASGSSSGTVSSSYLKSTS